MDTICGRSGVWSMCGRPFQMNNNFFRVFLNFVGDIEQLNGLKQQTFAKSKSFEMEPKNTPHTTRGGREQI